MMLSTTISAVLLAGRVLARPASAVSRLFMVRSLDFCLRGTTTGPLGMHHFMGSARAEVGAGASRGRHSGACEAPAPAHEPTGTATEPAKNPLSAMFLFNGVKRDVYESAV